MIFIKKDCKDRDKSLISKRGKGGLLFLFGGDHDDHPAAFQFGEALRNPVILKFFQHFQEEEFPPFLEDDGPAPEMDIGLYFGAFLEEFGGVLDLEFEIMVVRIGPEADFLNDRLRGIGLDFLLFLPLIVQEFVELDDPADRGIGIGGDHDKVLAHRFGPIPHLAGWVDARFYRFARCFADFVEVVPYEADVGYADVRIDLKLVFSVVLFGRSSWISVSQ